MENIVFDKQLLNWWLNQEPIVEDEVGRIKRFFKDPHMTELLDAGNFDELYDSLPKELRPTLTAFLILSDVEFLPYLTSIPEGCFSEMRGLLSVTIPDNIKDIKHSAFAWCKDLIQVDIKSAYVIGGYAFDSCKSLEKVILPDTVQTIQECAFAYCDSLKNLTLPSAIIFLGANLFIGSDELETLKYKGSADDFESIDFENTLCDKGKNVLHGSNIWNIECADRTIKITNHN